MHSFSPLLLPKIYVYAYAFVFGSVIGSFLNVCILRLPLDQSIVKPRSRCPKCGHSLAWYENIPILSWLGLRGKCLSCRAPISWQYPLIELTTAFLAVLLVAEKGLSIHTLVFFVFSASLIVVGIIDIHHRLIPDEISLSGIVVGFIYSFFSPLVLWWESLLGIVVGGGFLYLVAIGYEALRKEEGMGMGDVKLLAMIGAFLGWKALLFVVLVASLSGSVVGILFILSFSKGIKYQIPFGTFLAFAAILQLLYGKTIEMIWQEFLVRIIS